jgi:gentisate 1,2-dioxygenase
VRAGAREFAVDLHDVWNVPAMQPYAYRNTGTALYARLSYSNAPLLEKLGALYFEEDPKSVEIDAAASAAVQQRHRYARETAPDFSITPEGARLRGYEFLVDIEVLESRAIHWPFTATYPHLMASGNPNARGISLLYNPATERRNGVTHSFFATLAGRGPNVQPSAVGRGHRHSSVAINYYFIGNGGKSIVDGVTYEWGAGDLMLSAPSWSEHAHYVTASPVGNVTLTVQDHPLHIGMESLIWQEKMDGPILTLGSQAGVKGYVGPRRTSD